LRIRRGTSIIRIVIRAWEGVPTEILEFFRSRDPDKDVDRFWTELQGWYKDSDSNEWYGAWQGFVFPASQIVDPTIRANDVLVNAIFVASADFSDVTFTGDASFSAVTFLSDAFFSNATFAAKAEFNSVLFDGEAVFPSVKFRGDVDFGGASFAGAATFVGALFGGYADFNHVTFAERTLLQYVTFTKSTSFSDTQFARLADFSDAIIGDKILFDSLRLSSDSYVALRGCSLASVELRNLDLQRGSAAIRFADTVDIERLVATDVKWPQTGSRPLTADEIDLDSGVRPEGPKPSAEEVERIYRGFRKNHEDRGDRIGAHGWYFSEMEIGRTHAQLFSRRTGLRKASRGFYKATSNYGLSAIRPAIWLALGVVIALLLFSLGPGWCPARFGPDSATRVCVGPGDRLQVALLAIFLQPPPTGIAMSGVVGQVVWLLLRITGAAMLLSIGIAFRNQVAR
jgi:hypothetical protein